MSDSGVITVSVNGEACSLPGGATVSDALATLGLQDRPVAVELNLEVLPRTARDSHVLRDGDSLEVVSLIGGG